MSALPQVTRTQTMPFGGAAGEGLEHGAVTDDAVEAGGLAENDRLGHSVDGGLLLHPDAGDVLEALAEQFSSDAAGRDEGVVDVAQNQFQRRLRVPVQCAAITVSNPRVKAGRSGGCRPRSAARDLVCALLVQT
ncbi:hypothetical protein [Streptomyces sp. NBC_01005]|uniref:hypothetical protein n=1 Tax=Streptomyces sp. NBC_01005 TaxID=2903715 RepID=UPI003864D0E0